jgi:cytochrome c peroxidase
MRPSQRHFVAAGLLLIYVLAFAGATGSRAQEPDGNYGVGLPDVFLPKYLAYRTQQLTSGTPDVLRIRLGYVKGLSRSFTAMVGEAAVNLQSGAFSVSLSGLTPLQTYTIWLVDQARSEAVPPAPDAVFGLVTFLAAGSSALRTGLLPMSQLPFDFTIGRVVITPGSLWGTEALGAGSVNVFQKIFFRRSSLLNDSTGALIFAETTPPPALSALVPDLAAEIDALPSTDAPLAAMFSPVLATAASAASSGGGSVKLDKLISQGATLFFQETFGGNGRTCGTCHPASNNFTIDAPFIATRPANDPLFVAEFNPALAQLERPQLMRKFGLILENLDGFGNPTTKFVMRGVPHTLGLQVSLQRDTALVPAAPAEMTGWSGDGAPGTGSLREFAIGAVTQHFTRNLARRAGTDFTLPKEQQLDAMEAFQLSLGRSADVALARITFTDPAANTGKGLFINGGGNPNFGGTCNFCHTNGGANAAALGNENRNFNTNVEDVPHPARSVQPFPIDGGFGRTNNGDGTFGNRTFNTASVVEAADTAPFFHNNVTATLEAAVDFYSGPQFNNPRLPAARFNFNQTQRDQIVDFLRGLNTLQNIEVARRELQEIAANSRDPLVEQARRLQTAFDETQDAIDVLTAGGVFPGAVTPLADARNLISQAQVNTDSSQRRGLIQQAIAKLDQAKAAVATVAP